MSSRPVILRHCHLSIPSNPILSRSRLPQSKLPPTEPHSQRRCLAAGRAIPKILEPSMWTSMVPKFLRSGNRRGTDSAPRKSRAPNPATFYAIMFTLIGSQAIRMIMLRNEYANDTRSADAKTRLLKEVIERIQKGEDVDVKRLLGTGDEAKEREWEEVLKEIEQEESLWHSRAKRTHRGNVPKSDSDGGNDSQQSTTPQQSEPEITTKYQRVTSNEGPTTETSKPQRPSSFF
ncbi:hypothetical protein BDBG_04546 [Blastomyces gilchristii SLH14081]|uniref:Uncharacterized protein n=1 Tax=Blastomyces gilchristii (strain SLH14081) TaxID=559298 RepID=A0A179ULW2_BLAGS|nr:uncharacterized protein BDBG_04546 [Blastomyces gilchristii SLH14081]OAT08954.1 hypothetical protein BDBG_04546 [Blastomyces gilchristii SLH14081]